MKSVITCVVFLFILNASAESSLNIDFNNLVTCKGEFSYEKVFLMAGRTESEVLSRDAPATDLIKTIEWKGALLRPVSDAYSIKLYENHPHYESLRGHADRLAVAVVEDNDPNHSPEFDYDLILIVTEGEWAGNILAQHRATYFPNEKKLVSDRFECWE
jgi:hypothetical protein